MTSASFVPRAYEDFDGVLTNSKWTSPFITYSFPTSASYYGFGYGSNNETASGFEALDFNQQAAVTKILNETASFSDLNFSLRTESAFSHATLRFAMTNNTDGAHAYIPHSSDEGGDSWYLNHPVFDNPTIGGLGYEVIIHEIGHALGLAHGHESYAYGTIPYFQNSVEFSVMTYRDYIGDSTSDGDENETWGNAQSFMMLDIAALQYMYGADYGPGNVWSGNTTYTFSPTTGEMFINGVGQGTPGGNRVFRTIWDGNGNDTYDFSNYTTDFMYIDLRPGEWSTFSQGQRAVLQEGTGNYARGNIANALLHENDTRSLIENAIGGSGIDRITGNQAANILNGNGGDDVLDGGDGNDSLIGGTGNDLLLGDGQPAVYSGSGLLVDSTPGNHSIQTARSLDGLFTEVSRSDILYSVNVPQVTVQGSGSGQANYYSFTVLGNPAFIYLDIDYGYDATDPINPGNFNSSIQVFRSDGTIIGTNTGALTTSGGTGSNSTFDAYFSTEVQPGTYYVAVSGASPGTPIYHGQTYQLHVSVNGVVIGPSTSTTASDDILNGGAGNDALFGGDGNDTASYEGTAGALTIDLAAGTTTGADNDTLISIESVIGGSGNDVIFGTTGVNSLSGGAGNDTFYGRGGGDAFNGGSGTDLVGYNNVTGALFINLLTGQTTGALTDTLISIESAVGGSGNDILTGTSANNVLFGDLGNDTIIGSLGNDYLHGNGGTDIIDYRNITTGLAINLLAGTTTGAFSDTLLGFESAVGGSGNDILVGTDTVNLLTGGQGDDLFYGFGGDDNIDGGSGGGDVSIYAGTRSGLSVHTEFVGGEFVTTLTDLVGASGTDTLTNIETLRFGPEDLGLAGIQQNNNSNFDGDPFNELLFHHTTNNSTFYVDMDAAGRGSNVSVLGQVPGWTPVDTADMFGTGRAQVLYQNETTGGLVGYGDNGSGGIGWTGYFPALPANWSFEGVGDFTGDGFNDLMIMSPTGNLFYYDRDSFGVDTGWAYITTTANIWDPVDIGDFDRDGLSDILVQHRPSGTTYFMDMNAGVFSGWGLVAAGGGPDLVARGAADLNGDGFDDVVYRNQATGEITAINMAGGVNSGSFGLGPNLGTSYDIVGMFDYDNDGYDDIIVRYASTGQHVGIDINNGGFAGFDSLSQPLGDDWMLV
ncbi:MAG: hypothetical protein HEP70_00220 [Rhodobiaceae bacterium]|nr:hypothetical protein [Rhodobiaceae bacterium]